jgi:hypothetical protein
MRPLRPPKSLRRKSGFPDLRRCAPNTPAMKT